MMDPALKIAMALCVLLGGVCAALMFRRDAPRPALSGPAAQQLRIRSRNIGASQAAPSQDCGSALPADPGPPAPSPAPRPAVVVKPLDRQPSPPPLAAKYPESNPTASSRWGPSMEMMLPVMKDGARTHRIVDGDTLEGLARRYLGSADRAREIFDANRDVLADPKLLPIGAELKMPATAARQSPP